MIWITKATKRSGARTQQQQDFFSRANERRNKNFKRRTDWTLLLRTVHYHASASERSPIVFCQSKCFTIQSLPFLHYCHQSQSVSKSRMKASDFQNIHKTSVWCRPATNEDRTKQWPVQSKLVKPNIYWDACLNLDMHSFFVITYKHALYKLA